LGENEHKETIGTASPLDQMNPTELLASARLLLVLADSLPKDDPSAAELLRAAKRLLDLARSRSKADR
jgi:hypothetical protein